MSKAKVLIVCTHNSCRSIMAEAIINHDLPDCWEAFSAGTQPTSVNPRAIQVLQEIELDTTNLNSKSVSSFLSRTDIDLVITVCDSARETCPFFITPIEQKHISFPDPAEYDNESDEVALPKFREVRDAIRQVLVPYLKSLCNTNGSGSTPDYVVQL